VASRRSRMSSSLSAWSSAAASAVRGSSSSGPFASASGPR
jgi:hypothetical protein